MQKTDYGTLYSASDLVTFLECEHCTSLDVLNLSEPMMKAEEDEEAMLIAAKGEEHEAAFLQRLRDEGLNVVDVTEYGRSRHSREQATLAAMAQGADIIYQAYLTNGPFVGHIDFLKKVDRPSKFGDYSYEPMDTKLARTARAKFMIQLAYYCWLVSHAQDADPLYLHVVLGTNEEVPFHYAKFKRYFENLKDRFMAHLGNATPIQSYPDPCERCDICQWRERCDEQRVADDHLSQVAGIMKIHVKRLVEAGVTTMAKLAATPELPTGAKISPQTFERVQRQAEIQHRGRTTGERIVELLDKKEQEDGLRGFARLPLPNPGDIFFDMEGNPLEEGGLEYLFGNYIRNNDVPDFVTFWAHDRVQEKKAFEDFIDFVIARLEQYPDAYIYHYAPYEVTAMKKLMSVHATREAQVDNLLRMGKFIDLYKVVKESIRTSEPNYSIKSIEHFYLDQRTVDVKNAGASIVFYERWKQLKDPKLLQDIADYNFDDVRSTYECRQWLLSIRPDDIPWAQYGKKGEHKVELGQLTEVEKMLIPYRELMVDLLPEDRSTWGVEERVSELIYQLLDFHRRAAKPEWWSLFSRMEMTEAELIDDPECIGGMYRKDDIYPPEPEARSIKYTYFYPPQDTKLRTGVQCTRCDDATSLSSLEVFHDERRVTVKIGANREQPPEQISIGPGGPISSKPMVEALFRFADSTLKGDKRYRALQSLLRHELPRVNGVIQGEPIVPEVNQSLDDIIDAVSGMDETYLFLQGPPGAGKTYTGSHVIMSLIKEGYKVAVSSNSHHAINNLLEAVEKLAVKDNFNLYAAKKSTKGDSEYQGSVIQNVYKNEEIFRGGYQLVAGTAWLFSTGELDQQLDYLFVDEAGQVALANLLAMGTCARNIVLMGDQMQLAQPTQGVHPGRSGESTLDYLLEGRATIPAERGIFLKDTYRMHPDICGFISEAVYDGRLRSHKSTLPQKLVLNPYAHPALVPTGIQYIPVDHDGCAQDSAEEAEIIRELYDNLLDQEYVGKDGETYPMQMDNILVVAPYNMQVNRLKSILPKEARVGTVDKFQGQEAEVVLVSMATSNGDYLPRNIEFLYSKNRLNVAISRAKCLAVMVANPALKAIKCSTPEQMELVNTLCWVTSMSKKELADAA
jgi:uncharacterized protein